jgi:hypothetical protein
MQFRFGLFGKRQKEFQMSVPYVLAFTRFEEFLARILSNRFEYSIACPFCLLVENDQRFVNEVSGEVEDVITTYCAGGLSY